MRLAFAMLLDPFAMLPQILAMLLVARVQNQHQSMIAGVRVGIMMWHTVRSRQTLIPPGPGWYNSIGDTALFGLRVKRNRVSATSRVQWSTSAPQA